MARPALTVEPLGVVHARMAAQRLTGDGLGSAADVVRSLGAVQAQEYAEAKWSLAERMRGEPTDAELDAAFDRGEIVRTHVLRPTWHFVAPEDLRWMLALTAPRVHRATAYHSRKVGLDEETLAQAHELLRDALADGEPRTRKELGAALRAGGVEAERERLGHVMLHAELEALVCSGPRRGKQHTYVLVESRVPAAPERSRDDALAELTRRYFGGHGPATVKDFGWWSGLTLADCRRGIELAGGLVSREDAAGTTWWATRWEGAPAPAGAHLIPMYDELGVAFKDLRMVYAEQPPDRAMARPILIDGVCVGSWRRVIERRSVTLEATLFVALREQQRAALQATVERFGRFLGLPAALVAQL